MAEPLRRQWLRVPEQTEPPDLPDRRRDKGDLLEEFAVRASTAARTSRLDAAAAEVVHALAEVGVQPLLLKGAALARTLYRSDETRGYFDIDLLVSPDAVRAAGRVLHGLGYRNVTALQGVEGVAGSVHAEMWSALLPDFGNLTVDLHWRLEGCEVPPETAWSVLEAEHAVIELAGRDVRTLSRPGLASTWPSMRLNTDTSDLKAIADLSRGIERWPPEVWGRATGLARELAATEAFGAGLRLVPEGELLPASWVCPAARASYGSSSTAAHARAARSTCELSARLMAGASD